MPTGTPNDAMNAAPREPGGRRRVDIRCKSYPTIQVDGQPVALKLKRGLALLVYLDELARKVARTQLAETLWPDAPPDTARARLRRLCHEVNGVLGLDLVEGDADALWLDTTECSVQSDVARVRQSAQQLLGTPNEARSHETLEHLLASDSHRVLDGFELDSDVFSAWQDVRRSEQERLVARALSRAAEHLCASGQPALAAEAAARLIALDALADMGHAALLTARSQLGDAAGVEAAYFACAEVLRNELGIRPSANIETTYADARAQLAVRPEQRTTRPSLSPPIRFADSADGSVAYLELGSGDTTLVILFGLWSHLEVSWEEPRIRAILDRLSRSMRVVLVDRRGTGLSDRINQQQSARAGVEDIDAVRRALGVEQVWLLGNSVGGAIAIEYASVFPTRVQGLMLYGTGARGTWAPDYPWALTEQQQKKWLHELQSSWGGATSLAQFAPSMVDDQATRDWWARMLRQSASKNGIPLLLRALGGTDVCARLPALQVPTLVLQRKDDLIVREGAGRYLASHIPGAQFVLLEGIDHPLWYGDTSAALDEMERFVQAHRQVS
ncbi:alpha/beta hydrolase [Hydrogenophaga sp.]|uniref:alpha/beta hydrolase n=1 Tax=Hydrogenophaga sp. TaxID=1904254 RepID=UPI0025BED30A|nr:alpha/beta hydrolase [Hydrogenophaga sp.]MBT9464445.1 alpha/beta fold hydrolase [Hydrogenophaga sp.]